METKEYVIKVTRFFTHYKEHYYYSYPDGDLAVFGDKTSASDFCSRQIDEHYDLEPLELRRPSYIPVLGKTKNKYIHKKI